MTAVGIRVGGRIAGPIYGSVGCGTALAIIFFAVGAIVAMGAAVLAILTGAFDKGAPWAEAAIPAMGVAGLAGFVGFAFWWNHPRQIAKRQQRRRMR